MSLIFNLVKLAVIAVTMITFGVFLVLFGILIMPLLVIMLFFIFV